MCLQISRVAVCVCVLLASGHSWDGNKEMWRVSGTTTINITLKIDVRLRLDVRARRRLRQCRSTEQRKRPLPLSSKEDALVLFLIGMVARDVRLDLRIPRSEDVLGPILHERKQEPLIMMCCDDGPDASFHSFLDYS